MTFPVQVTRAAKTTLPIEGLLRDDTLKDTLLQMHNFLIQDAMRRIREYKSERLGDVGMPEVRLISESHAIFTFAGVATISLLATFEEV